ncbi:MAG: hypothetical protein NZZ60_06350 [Bacteroidia bacterium]|nr:hypothetical protein [Bacteroidia bacterium]MDW8415920.1 hypothetical protein [Bacteroidia bacterium]
MSVLSLGAFRSLKSARNAEIEYIYAMKDYRLPSDALWRVVRLLDDREHRRLRERIKGTRWEWLLDTLLHMEEYSDEKLREAYRREFPSADERLLRVYKRQFWDLLEQLLPTRETEGIQEEVRLWQRLWLSLILWRRGDTETAEVIWLQVMEAAIRSGWYEFALWGLMLLEMYSRDFHRFAPGIGISSWSQKLLTLVAERYGAIAKKIAASEEYVASRIEKGWRLPELPVEDKWARYMSHYEKLIRSAKDSDFQQSLSAVCDMLEILCDKPQILRGQAEFHEAISWTNLGIILLNLGAWKLYDQWYEAWQSTWRCGYWSAEERFEALHRLSTALRLGYLIKSQQWQAARRLYDAEKAEIAKHVFESGENVGFRLSTACGVYLILLLLPKHEREPIQWRLRVESWLEKEGYRDSEYLWWVFLRWYEAYLSKSRIWIRYWHRFLRNAWQTYFQHDKRWRPVLRLLWSLTEGLQRTWRRRASAFLASLQINKEEAQLWENDSVIFPMRLFVEGLLKGRALQELHQAEKRGAVLPDSLVQRVSALIYSLHTKSTASRV